MKALFIGAPIQGVSVVADFNQQFERTGHNTGNLLIGTGLYRQIPTERHFNGTFHSPEFIEEHCQLIAIAAANWIYEGFDFGQVADYLEKISSKIPMVVVGLGAQVPSSTAISKVNIPTGTRRLLEIFADRCIDIGVRGEYTADVLSRMGVKNVTVTGCPSYYMNCMPTLEINAKEFHDEFNISLNGSRNVYSHSFNPAAALSVESELIRMSQRSGYDFVLQNETPELQIVHDHISSRRYLAEIHELLDRHDLALSVEEYVEWIKRSCKAFYDIDDWSRFIQTKDLSIGSRFHGNLIALLNGVPSILIAHDSRTTEMAEFMKIPHVVVDKCDLGNIRSLYEAADFKAFSENYASAYRNYIAFLDRNNVPHRLTPPVPPLQPDEAAGAAANIRTTSELFRFEVNGYCPVCEKDTEFVAERPDKIDERWYAGWFRNSLRCTSCNSPPRERAIAHFLTEYRPDWRDLIIHESSPGGAAFSAKLRRECKTYVPTHYDPGFPFGIWHKSGKWRNEDLERQTFADEAFDIVIAQDVFAYLFHPGRAAREIARTLKPGGLCLLTVPVAVPFGETRQRARTDDGVVTHLLPEIYHGNPVGDGRSLVTVDWSYDIGAYLSARSGMAFTVLVLDDMRIGVRDSVNAVLVARKPALADLGG